MADTHDCFSCAVRRGGSSPSPRAKFLKCHKIVTYMCYNLKNEDVKRPHHLL